MLQTKYVQWLGITLLHAAWAPLLVFSAHVLCSRILHAYSKLPGLDVPMHFCGGLAIAFFIHVASSQGSRLAILAPYNPVTHAALVFGLTCAAALFWEFAEFLSDRYLGTHAQGNDLEDTLSDLLLGMTGALAFLLVLFSASKTARKSENRQKPNGIEEP